MITSKDTARIAGMAMGGLIVITHQIFGGDGESMLLAGVLIGAPVGSYVEDKVLKK